MGCDWVCWGCNGQTSGIWRGYNKYTFSDISWCNQLDIIFGSEELPFDGKNAGLPVDGHWATLLDNPYFHLMTWASIRDSKSHIISEYPSSFLLGPSVGLNMTDYVVKMRGSRMSTMFSCASETPRSPSGRAWVWVKSFTTHGDLQQLGSCTLW